MCFINHRILFPRSLRSSTADLVTANFGFLPPILPYMVEGARRLSLVSFIRTLVSLMRQSPHDIITSQYHHHPRVRISIPILGRPNLNHCFISLGFHLICVVSININTLNVVKNKILSLIHH